MRRLKCFEILLNNRQRVFYAGDDIKGKILIDSKSDVKCTQIRITLRGLAKVHWTESRSTGNRLGAYTEHYNAEIEYFNLKKIVYDAESIDDHNFDATSRGLLPSGIHEFHFSFSLPSSGISTSFEGRYASIRYWLKAEVERSWTFNHKTKKAISVMSKIDVNRREYQIGSQNDLEQRLCCWCCISGPISVHARTDRKAYCPGESIGMSIHLENHSSRLLTPSVTLFQTQTFSTGGKSLHRKFKLSTVTGDVLEPNKSIQWDTVRLKVPAVSPSILNCAVIKVEYFLRVIISVRGNNNLSIDLPIVIGTIPFRPFDNDHQISPNNHLSPTSARTVHSRFVPPAAPPAYEEISGSNPVDEDRTTYDPFFTPMYTYVDESYERLTASLPPPVNDDMPPEYSESDPHPL